MSDLLPSSPWIVTTKFDARGAELADSHYSRRTHGSSQFMPPGQTLILKTPGGDAIFGWVRPRPDPNVSTAFRNNLDAWMCSIFRNESRWLSSFLILAAEGELLSRFDCGPDGLITYVYDSRIRSTNPGCCFKKAGWKKIGRSADNKKTLLQKPLSLLPT